MGFETISAPVVGEEEIDRMAEKVFMESIRIAGGLRQVISFRNLTWVPSLAAASYAVVLKEVFLYTTEKIAEFLGLSTSTVRTILSADPAKIEEFLEGKLERVDEHKAGGLAKLAFQRLKERGELSTVEVSREAIEEMERELPDFAWPILVLHYIRGLRFPAKREEVAERLKGKGITVRGKPIEELLPKLPEEISSPAHLLKELSHVSEGQ